MNRGSASLARQLQQLCTRIGNEAADECGFVAIRELLSRFQIQLICRPLLVEGMLATIDSASSEQSGRWTVLIDSETYPETNKLLPSESSQRPLPVRARNTIAHELTHSLGFRSSEFGLQLSVLGNAANESDLVRLVEQETERLSPLLLFPEKAIETLLKENPRCMTLAALKSFREKLGVSRQVFISRLQMLRANDERGFLQTPGLQDVAIGTIEWGQVGPALRSWPLFMNFRQNITPDLLLRTLKQDRLRPIDGGIPSLSILCGGTQESIEFECDARVVGAQKPERIAVSLQVEPRRPRANTSMFLLKKS